MSGGRNYLAITWLLTVMASTELLSPEDMKGYSIGSDGVPES